MACIIALKASTSDCRKPISSTACVPTRNVHRLQGVDQGVEVQAHAYCYIKLKRKAAHQRAKQLVTAAVYASVCVTVYGHKLRRFLGMRLSAKQVAKKAGPRYHASSPSMRRPCWAVQV